MQQFEMQREEALLNFLDYLGTRDAVLNYRQIQGLLFAMACSPEPIKPTEWFELIWLNDDPQFENPVDAKSFYQLLVELFNRIANDVRYHRYRPVESSPQQNLPQALADWCDGFLLGHQYLEEVWLVAFDQLDDDQLCDQVSAALDWALAFVEGDLIEWFADDRDDLFAAEYLQFQEMLDDYRSVHVCWRATSAQLGMEQAFAAMQSPARDDLCDCGSGKPFARCCLH